MSKEAVTVVMVLLFLGIIVWDIWLALDDKKANTISARLRRIGPGLRLLVVFGTGLVIGHLYW